MDTRIVLLVLHFITLLLYVNGEGNYECGEHGRFEYCIDGIPGCVVGCYCHPGYYFDTDTKICEHNSKITAHARAVVPQEPLTPQPPPLPPPPPTVSEAAELPPSPQSSDSLIDKLESMDKTATDDLSDWLYNQFFKTVESQVINKTDGVSKPSRRSGRGSIIQHIRKKGHRKGKRKSKKKDSRRKLLKITENDSVFDSSSSECDSSSSESCSGSSSSESSTESEDKDDKEYKNRKKLIMYQKRPKAPLPSFIFLPNAGETPYFPPIGLPPPPPMPMYPMVPVPPMVLIIPEKNKTTTTQATTVKQKTDKSEESDDDTTTTKTTTASTTTAAARRRKTFRKTPTKTLRGINLPTDKDMREKENMFNNLDFSPAQQFKLLQKLRDRKRMNLKHRQLNPRKGNINKNLPHVSGRRTGVNNPLEEIGLDINPQDFEDIPPETQEIDFKYITELIHNKSNSVPSQNGKNSQNINNVGDGYYSALGKEIAGLVRETATGVDQTFAGQSPQESDQLQYFENSYSPRSYWERSVRSPYFYDRLEELGWPKRMNQKLFDLEDKVRLAVKTYPKLKLEELEDVISAMGKTQILNQEQRFRNEEPNLNTNLKVSLMPIESSINDIKLIYGNRGIENIPHSNNFNYPKEREISNYILGGNQEDNPIIWDRQMIKNATQITRQNERQNQMGYKDMRFKETNYPSIYYLRPNSRIFPNEINRKENNSYVAATTRNLKSLYFRSPIILNSKNMKFAPKVRETHIKNFYSPYYPLKNSVKPNISPFSYFNV